MNTPANVAAAPAGLIARMEGLIRFAIGLAGHIPDALIALLGRFSIAAVFWKSGQTKVQGFAIDIVSGEFHFGMPQLSDSAVAIGQL